MANGGYDPWADWGTFFTDPGGASGEGSDFWSGALDAALDIFSGIAQHNEWSWYPGYVEQAPGNGNGGAPAGETWWERFIRELQGPNGGGTVANGTANNCVANFMHAPSGVPRMKSEVVVENPVTGKLYWYKNKGRPMLWADDLAAKKRCAKVARKAGRKR